MVADYGMSPLGVRAALDDEPVGDARRRAVDEAIDVIIAAELERATQTLADASAEHAALVALLLEHKVLDQDALARLAKGETNG